MSDYSVLVVEDEASFAEALTIGLGREGFAVSVASDGADALRRFDELDPDLVLLDVMLPGRNGFRVCADLRAEGNETPILMLTAKSGEYDEAEGLDAGADDYLTKPFEPKELSARIRALLRRARSQNNDNASMSFGELEVAPDEGVVLLRGEPVHLTKTEFKLLVELASGPGKVFSRETLLEKVWGYDYFGDGRLVDVHVRRLRTKIEPDPADPRYVVTVRGLGYKLVP